jgi:hypothetical protein
VHLDGLEVGKEKYRIIVVYISHQQRKHIYRHVNSILFQFCVSPFTSNNKRNPSTQFPITALISLPQPIILFIATHKPSSLSPYPHFSSSVVAGEEESVPSLLQRSEISSVHLPSMPLNYVYSSPLGAVHNLNHACIACSKRRLLGGKGRREQSGERYRSLFLKGRRGLRRGV